MVFDFLSRLLNIWPFSPRKLDDLKASNRLVRRLSVSEQTKKFVFAIQEPESQAVVYILAVQNLSEQAAADAECLIKEVRPEVVIAQVGPAFSINVLAEDSKSRDDLVNSMPTTSFGVLKGCIVDKVNKEIYEIIAGNLCLQEIFGVGFHGHVLAAKKAAEEVGSSFVLFKSPFLNADVNSCNESDKLNEVQGLEQCNLIPLKRGTGLPKRLLPINDREIQMVKSLSSYLCQVGQKLTPTSVSEGGMGQIQQRCNYNAPSFAQSIYPLLADLCEVFVDVPSMGRALAYAQKMLLDVDRGETVDAEVLSEVQVFRIAVEGLRIALNKNARCSNSRSSAGSEFSELSTDDKSDVFLAEALRSQTKNFKTIVAVVEAKSLEGLRNHWKTPVPIEVEDLAKKLFTRCKTDMQSLSIETANGKKLLPDKPMVAVGAGATAILGASLIHKLAPISTFMKVPLLKLPFSLKFFLGKIFGPSKLAHGMAGYGAKTTSVYKATASVPKIRALVHCTVASAERTSLSIVRTSFYEIMRKRRIQPIGSVLWATFGSSLAVCTGLFMYGEGIECAAESLPSAPSIACLGRGIRSLHQVSKQVREANSSKIQDAMLLLMHSS